MFNTFVTSFKLKNTYRVNSIIYSLKQVPLLKKLLPSSLYKSKFLKSIGNVFSILSEIGSIFIGKFIYVFIMIFMVSSFFENRLAFIHIFFFLTILGGIINTIIFEPTKDKYYAINIMKMDARAHVLTNYYYESIKTIIGFMLPCLIFGYILSIEKSVTTMMPLFVVSIKMIFNNIKLNLYNKYGINYMEKFPFKYTWILIIVLLLLAYGLSFFEICITENLFMIFFLITFVFGIISMIKMHQSNKYTYICKQLLKDDNVIFGLESDNEILKESMSNQISDTTITSDKKGYSYFHDLFVQRHNKLLIKTARFQTIIIGIILLVVLFLVFMFDDLKMGINNVMLTYLPYFVFIMYVINTGKSITEAMFVNCDHSMLTYRFYRNRNTILGLFKERLKTIVTINLIPALLIALALPLLLFVTGGTNNLLNYIILFISIISMCIFFSVHNLILYYLLQPYNLNTELKSSTYGFIQGLTYVVCYLMIELKLPTFYFGLATIIFCITYVIISLLLAYFLAPKTFKLRN